MCAARRRRRQPGSRKQVVSRGIAAARSVVLGLGGCQPLVHLLGSHRAELGAQDGGIVADACRSQRQRVSQVEGARAPTCQRRPAHWQRMS